MALKFFLQGPPKPKLTPPSLVDALRDLSHNVQTGIEKAIETAAPLEHGGQHLGRILDEGLQAVEAKARRLEERLDVIVIQLREEGERRTESEDRLREIVALLTDEKKRMTVSIEVCNETTATLRDEVNRLGRVMFRSYSASESAVTCLKQALDHFKGEATRRDREMVRADDFLTEIRDEIKRRMLTGMLPVLDSLDDGIRQGEEIAGKGHHPFSLRRTSVAEGQSAWLDGIQLVRRRLERILGDEGVQRIEAVGKIFDPKLHRAVGVVKNGEQGVNRVVREERPGFTFAGAVIRYAEVVISK